MIKRSPVVVTGATGRLGGALIDALRDRQLEAHAMSRPDYDLDDPESAHRVAHHGRGGLVFHCAAWTDVDGNAELPELAMRRNAEATAELASACAANDAALVFMSTNEIFDGQRRDGRGYTERDTPSPINPYGASKLAGEEACRAAYAQAEWPDGLWIVRTAWLFGPPGDDFPTRILAAADDLAPGEALSVVDDELGTPTYSRDLAVALIDLVEAAPADTYHLAPVGATSRFEVARLVLDHCRPGLPLKAIDSSSYRRPSRPPAWAVLDSSRAAQHGVTLRDWRPALLDYLSSVCV